MKSADRHRIWECSVCKKRMRSDSLKRHGLRKNKNVNFQVTKVVRGYLKDKDSQPSSNEDLESEIVANGKLLNEKIALGEKINKVLTNTNTKEESLSKKHKKDFD